MPFEDGGRPQADRRDSQAERRAIDRSRATARQRRLPGPSAAAGDIAFSAPTRQTTRAAISANDTGSTICATQAGMPAPIVVPLSRSVATIW